MKFSRQEYWRGLPFPSLGDLPDPEIEPMSPTWQEESLPLSHLGSPYLIHTNTLIELNKGRYIYIYIKLLISTFLISVFLAHHPLFLTTSINRRPVGMLPQVLLSPLPLTHMLLGGGWGWRVEGLSEKECNKVAGNYKK